MLIPKLIFVFLLLSACSEPVPTAASQATSIPKMDHVEGVGRILSSAPTTVFPQNIHVSQDAISYWFEECSCAVKFDPKSGKEVASIEIGQGKAGLYGNPKDMAVDGTVVWVTDAGHSAVVRIDPATNQIAEQIPLEFTDAAGKTEQIQPFGLALDGKTLWVSDFDQNLVVRVDTETKKITAAIPDINNPEGITANSHGVWIVEHCSSKIVHIDPDTNKITATISIPTPEPATSMGAVECALIMWSQRKMLSGRLSIWGMAWLALILTQISLLQYFRWISAHARLLSRRMQFGQLADLPTRIVGTHREVLHVSTYKQTRSLEQSPLPARHQLMFIKVIYGLGPALQMDLGSLE